jgi:hypothetical protein
VRRAVALLVALSSGACGRVYFDPLADGSPDTAPDADSCGHTFCDTFSRVDDVLDEWTALSIGAGGTPSLAAGRFRVELPATGDSAFLEKEFPITAGKVTVHSRFSYASADPSTAEVDLIQLQWLDVPISGCSTYGAFLVRDGSVAPRAFLLQETYDGCGANVNDGIVNLDNAGEHDVVMVVTLGDPTRITVDLDGTRVKDVMAAHAATPSRLRLRLGAGGSRDITALWTIEHDDVYVDLE